MNKNIKELIKNNPDLAAYLSELDIEHTKQLSDLDAKYNKQLDALTIQV